MLINDKIEKSLLSLLHNTNDELYLYFNPFNTMGENPTQAIEDYKKNWTSPHEQYIALATQKMWQLLVMNDDDENAMNVQLAAQSATLPNLLKNLIVFGNTEMSEGIEELQRLLLLNIDNEKGSINVACYTENKNEPKNWLIHVYPNNGQAGYALRAPTLNSCITQLINYKPALNLHKI